jgi:hypothetical protein
MTGFPLEDWGNSRNRSVLRIEPCTFRVRGGNVIRFRWFRFENEWSGSWSRNFPLSVEPSRLLTYSHECTTGLYSGPHKSKPNQYNMLNIHFNSILFPRPKSTEVFRAFRSTVRKDCSFKVIGRILNWTGSTSPDFTLLGQQALFGRTLSGSLIIRSINWRDLDVYGPDSITGRSVGTQLSLFVTCVTLLAAVVFLDCKGRRILT